jgi:Ran GTPase-activating protein (RanGAP) involved in mRNA processing and transport
MEFILLMDRIKCSLNPPLQVLTVAPALHSLVIHDHVTSDDILQFLIHKHVDLRKLILKNCWLGEDDTGLLANIVDLYADLEGLSLKACFPLTSAEYGLLPRLKKLTELNLSHSEVHYVCV